MPDTVRFATKPRLTEQMLTRAFAVGIPARWVTGDSGYGSDRPLQRFLDAHPIGYVLGVTRGYTVRPYTAGGLAQALPQKTWKRLSAGPGSKGPRWYEWARSPLGPNEGEWDRWLLLRRSLDEAPEYAYYCVRAPHDTTLKQMVAVAGQRWAVEECFETAKGECGLDEYEVCRWTGWYRHVTLSMLALAYLTVVRARATATQAPKKEHGRATRRTDSAHGAGTAGAAVALGLARGAVQAIRARLVPAETQAPSHGTAPTASALRHPEPSSTVGLEGVK